MAFKLDNQSLPVELSEAIVSFLHYKDLVNASNILQVVDERLWRKFLKRKLWSTSSWANSYTFLGWPCYKLTSHIDKDVQKICADIKDCNTHLRMNWKHGRYTQREICFEKCGENEEKSFPGCVAFNNSRIAVWWGKSQKNIMVLWRHNFAKEKELDCQLDLRIMSLYDDLLIAGFGVLGLIRMWDIQSGEMVKELHDNVSGPVKYLNYSQGMLITLSKCSSSPGTTVLTTRRFTSPNDITETEECLLPFWTTGMAAGFDGKFLSFYGSVDHYSLSDEEPEKFGIFIWTVYNLSFVRWIPEPEGQFVKSLKSSNGLLFAAYFKLFCIYDIQTGSCLREVKQNPSGSINSISLISEFIMTACKGETETEDNTIKIWKLSDLCQKSIPESECLAFSIVSPSLLTNGLIGLMGDSFQIVGYDGKNQARLIGFDFWKQTCED